jgi:FeS assembly SUF system protein
MAEREKQRLHLPLSGEKPESPGAKAGPPVFAADAPLEDKVIATLRTCYDPELPVNIVELGLIYELRVEEPGEVHIRMTLTAPNCPVAGSILSDVKRKVEAIPGVGRAEVELVWDPPWDSSRMSEAARLELGLF